MNLETAEKQQAAIMEMFSRSGALLQGHFRLTSGLHSQQYMQCALVLQYPQYAQALGQMLGQRFQEAGVQTVIGPALGGVVVAHEVARSLGQNVRSIFAEREAGKMSLRRGFAVSPGERLLVVEDVVTTGGSVLEVVELVQEMGAEVVGVGVLVDRSGGKLSCPVRFESLLKMNIQTYSPDDCPFCRQGIPVVKPGSRQQTV